jgi:hypothetical protein
MKYQVITLRVIYKDDNYSTPLSLDFENLLDLEEGESVKILSYSKPVNIESEQS